MTKLWLVGALALMMCALGSAHSGHKDLRMAAKQEGGESAFAEALRSLGTREDLITLFNKPMLCCINDVRVRNHLEGILAAALDAFENGKLSQAVRLTRLFVQRVETLGCEAGPCLDNALELVSQIVRYIASSNTIKGKEGMLLTGDELKAEGLIEAALIAYSQAFDIEILSLTLHNEQSSIVRPVYFDTAFSAAGVVVSPTVRPRKDRPQPGGRLDDDGDDDTVPQEGRDSGEAFETDCQLVSTQFGWTLEATKDRMRNQTAFADLVKTFTDLYPSSFAGSAMARNPGDYATVWFKGPAPSEVQQQVDDFYTENGMWVKVIDQMRFSVVDQEARMMTIASVLAQQGFTGIGSAFYPGDIIYVSLPSDPNSFPPTTQSSHPPGGGGIEPAVTMLLGDELDPWGIKFVFTPVQEIDRDHHARGGRMAYTASEPDGSYSVCTTGFTVQSEAGINGVTTAAHCTGMSNFDAEAPEADFPLYHKGEHCETYGDVEWKGSDHSEPAEFWANHNDLRAVESVARAFSVNDVYCVYSRIQGTRTCDYVFSTSTSQTGTLGYCLGRTAYNLVAFDNDLTVPGDSGGPISYSTQAAGTIKGAKYLWYSYRGTMTRADLFNSALGVQVKLSAR
mmetsp:Transcript_1731/g.3930  ORF Transcript_1731/g.3930 Transcript_1731/m.3930 type:complete len:623 (-) Transcript_1731:184-2052(-)